MTSTPPPAEPEPPVSALLDAIPAIVFVISPDGAVQFLSAAWYAYTGTDPAALPAGTWTQAIYPADLARVRVAWDAARPAGMAFELEVRLLSRAGVYQPFHVRSRPERDAAGTIFRWVGVASELTGRQLGRQAQLLELAYEPILVRRLDGTILEWNRAAEQLYGWTEAEARGQISHSLLRTEPADSLAAQEQALAETGSWVGELEHHTRDGRPIFVESRQLLVRQSGEPPLVLETNHDITERRQAEATLRQAARRAQTLQAVADRLAGALTLDQVTNTILTQGSAALGASAAVVLALEAGDWLSIVQSVGFPPGTILAGFPLAAPFPAAQAVRDRALVAVTSLDDFARRYLEATPQREQTGQAAALYLPLELQEQVLGALVFSFAQPREFDADDQAFGLTLASLCAQALERARLFEAEQRARRAAEAAALRLAGLQAITAGLNRALTREQVAAVVIEQALPALGAQAGNLVVLSADGAEFEMIASRGQSDGRTRAWQRFPARPGLPMHDVVASGQPLLLPNREAMRARYPELAETAGAANAWVLVPLSHGGRNLGGLTLVFNQAREFGAEDEAIIRAFGQQCGLALERADLYQQAQALNASLERRVAARTAELEQSRGQLRALSQHVDSVREDERAHLSREIHDQLGGRLTGLKMDLAVLRRRLHEPEALAQIEDLARAIDETVQLIRQIASDLRPAVLDDFGLPATLEWKLAEFQQRSQLDCHFEASVDEFEWQPENATALFRVFEEALTNVARHAQATRVEVSLAQTDGQVILRLHDNGRGIRTAELTGARSLGLLGMRERLRPLAGELEIEGTPAHGTTVTIRVPLDRLRAEAAPPPGPDGRQSVAPGTP